NYREAGKRKRAFFEKKGAADSFASFKNAELKRDGIVHAEFPAALRHEAQKAVERLTPFGRTINDAVEYYLAHLKATERSITVADLVTQLIAVKKADGLRPRYIQDLRSPLPRFSFMFGQQMGATVTTQQIDDWLRSLSVGPTTRNNFRRTLVTLFSYAVDFGYAQINPALKAVEAQEIDTPPGILSVEQTARLLEAASPQL